MKEATEGSRLGLLGYEEGCDLIEDQLCATIEAVFDGELDTFLGCVK
ncbi:MAG: hypothetical protein OXI08_04715 [Cyanobacteria bacterium MAG IRC4_bin_6]|nr:hypothetical protein [Cyanobacteria bacterium MAG IRC3_bin_20]MDE0647346.1 hypothetical protein [Cyanobacteria bacterium MAG IRC4_bin_6]